MTRLPYIYAIPVAVGMAALAGCGARGGSMRLINVPVANVRTQPGSLPESVEHDDQQETQLLYGERVRVLRAEQGWALVEAVEQPELTHHGRWEGYPGWVLLQQTQPVRSWREPNAVVRAKWATLWSDDRVSEPVLHVPIGTALHVTPTKGDLWRAELVGGQEAWISRGQINLTDDLDHLSAERRRRAVIQGAEEMLGDPYFWGGRSPSGDPTSSTVTGVDCSGLVNLAYRSAGVILPRDSHEQSLKARPVLHPEPADLIFLSSANDPRKIVHVMLYAGGGMLIEGPGTGQAVRRISVEERFGRPVDQLRAGDRISGQTVSFGSYLGSDPPSLSLLGQ